MFLGVREKCSHAMGHCYVTGIWLCKCSFVSFEIVFWCWILTGISEFNCGGMSVAVLCLGDAIVVNEILFAHLWYSCILKYTLKLYTVSSLASVFMCRSASSLCYLVLQCQLIARACCHRIHWVLVFINSVIWVVARYICSCHHMKGYFMLRSVVGRL